MNRKKLKRTRKISKLKKKLPAEDSNSDSDTPISKRSEKTLTQKDIAYYKLAFFGPYLTDEQLESLQECFLLFGVYIPPRSRSELFPTLYEKCKEDRMSLVAQTSKVCLTCEFFCNKSECFWNRTAVFDKICTITAHFVDANFKQQSVLLFYKKIEDECCDLVSDDISNSQWIVDNLTCIMDYKWILRGKINVIVIKNDLEISNDAIKDENVKFIKCFASTFNSIVLSALKPIESLIEKIHKILLWFKQDCDDLIEYQKVRCGGNFMKPKICHTDIWCTYIPMLERLISLEEFLKPVMQLESFQNKLIEGKLEVLVDDEWSLLQQLVEVLSPFQEVAMSLSDQGFLKASEVIVIVRALLVVCDKVDNHCRTIIKDIIKGIKEGLNQHFKDIENDEILSVCTIMDPRYKECVFSNEKAAKVAISNLEKKVEQIITEKNHSPDRDTATSSERLSIWACLDGVQDNCNAAMNEAAREVEIYLKRDVIDRKEDPLKWWHENANIYPNLAELYLNECYVFASSVPCGRIFRKNDIFDSEERMRLSNFKVEFLRSNMTEEELFEWYAEIT